MSKHSFWVAAAFLIAGPGAGHTETPVQACQLVSQLEVERTLQMPAVKGDARINADTLTACIFRAEQGRSVSILVRRRASREWVAEQQRRMSGSAQFHAVSGLGDSAYRLNLPRAAALCVFRGDDYLEVYVRAGEARVPVAAEELARTVLSRM